MNTEKEIAFTLAGIHELAAKIIRFCSNKGKILCFYGPMGAGKTTLIKAIVQALNGKDQGHSPTFGLVNEYAYKDGSLLGYHFDFYRLENELEALDMGFEEYVDSGSWIFIEWPEKIPSFLPENAVKLHLNVIDIANRSVILQ